MNDWTREQKAYSTSLILTAISSIVYTVLGCIGVFHLETKERTFSKRKNLND